MSTFHKTPIALFTYNRPRHVATLLESLLHCARLDECELHIYCDGPRIPEDAALVEASRVVVHDWADRLGAKVIERPENLGLARSVVTGVTELCEQHGRVIVLEDDFILSPAFLDYMLQALDRYQNESQVYQISGYMFPVEHPEGYDAFFLPLTTTWGWATWKRAWRTFEWSAKIAHLGLSDSRIRERFDLDGSYPYSQLLEARLSGKNDSWGIVWWWAVFEKNGLVLHPRRSLVWVGGFDGSGTHNRFQQNSPYSGDLAHISGFALNRPLIFPKEITTDASALNRIKRFLKNIRSKSVPTGHLSKHIKRLGSWVRRIGRLATPRQGR